MSEELGFTTDKTVVMCGPPIMIKFTLAALMELGFAREQVYTTMELKMKCALGKVRQVQHRQQIRLQGRTGLPV